MKTLNFECDDRYEAEKLASLMSVQKDNTLWVSSIQAMIGNEIVIQLKDRSSHSVVLKDEETVVKLKSFMTDVIKGKIKIHSSDYLGSVTGITIVG
jgi:hypothetical protein